MKLNYVSYFLVIAGILICAFEFSSEDLFNLSVFSESRSDGYTIVIDPGHGGEDGGAVGVSGILEKGINLSISEKLRDILAFYGYNTLMTRTNDTSIHDESGSVKKRKISDMKNRVKLVNRAENPVLLSIHLNFFPQPDCKGAQVFYSGNTEESKFLAESVQNKLLTGIMDNNKRQIKKAEKSLYLLNNVYCPAILTECGFLSNPDEESLLVTEEYQIKLASCISAGFLEYAGTNINDG